MSKQELLDRAVAAHDRYLAYPTADNLAAFLAARDAWFAMGGGKSC